MKQWLACLNLLLLAGAIGVAFGVARGTQTGLIAGLAAAVLFLLIGSLEALRFRLKARSWKKRFGADSSALLEQLTDLDQPWGLGWTAARRDVQLSILLGPLVLWADARTFQGLGLLNVGWLSWLILIALIPLSSLLTNGLGLLFARRLLTEDARRTDSLVHLASNSDDTLKNS